VTAPTPPSAGLETVDVARLTAGALFLAAQVGAGPGSGPVVVVPNVDRPNGRLTLEVRRESPEPIDRAQPRPLIEAAARLLVPIGGSARLGDHGDSLPAVLMVPLELDTAR
jgi:hypothetical protein